MAGDGGGKGGLVVIGSPGWQSAETDVDSRHRGSPECWAALTSKTRKPKEPSVASNLRPIAQLTAILLRATVIVAVSPAVSREHRLECPAEAPIEWGMAKRAPLDGPAVLAQPTGLPINDQSPPLLVPDRGYAHDGVWHNVWIIGEEAGWTYFVDCRYRTSARVLRLGRMVCANANKPRSRITPKAESRRMRSRQ